MRRITSATAVRAVLDDDRYLVTPVPGDAPRGTLRWLRARMPRFSEGPAHRRRRALAEDLLRPLPPARLRARAASRARALRRSQPEEQVVESVPVLVLAEGLGFLRSGLDEVALVRAVVRLAACYQPHLPQAPDADEHAAMLLEAAPGASDDERAVRVGLLLQACPAVATLTRNALLGGRSLGRTLRDDPPARTTRRVAPDGDPLELDLTAWVVDWEPALAFGWGRHACPGQAQALAIAAGMLDVLARAAA